jgi:hypothetical protein
LGSLDTPETCSLFLLVIDSKEKPVLFNQGDNCYEIRNVY